MQTASNKNEIREKMKATQMQQTSKLLLKYFQNNFDIHKLALNSKKGIKQVETKLKDQIKSILIELEGSLFRAKKVTSMIFINMSNPEIQKRLLNIDKILDKKSIQDFINYYRSNIIQLNIHGPRHLQTVYPISAENRLRIYNSFVNYARSEHLLSHQKPMDTALDIIKKGFSEEKTEIFDQRQLDFVYVIYGKNQGDIDAMCEQIQNRGFKDVKFQRNVLYFKIANLKLLGLYYVYKKTAQWMENNILRFNKFIKCYGNIYESWTPEQNKRLIKIAITEQVTIQEVKQITLKMGRQSAACFLQMMANNRYQAANVPEEVQYQEIPIKFQPVYEQQNLADSIRNQIRKKIEKNKKQ